MSLNITLNMSLQRNCNDGSNSIPKYKEVWNFVYKGGQKGFDDTCIPENLRSSDLQISKGEHSSEVIKLVITSKR